MLAEHTLMSLTGQLYDAAADGDKWPVVIGNIARAFESQFAILTVIDCQSREIRFASFHNLDAVQLEQVRPILEQRDPLYRAFVRRLNKPVSCRRELKLSTYLESQFYREVMQPYGLEFRMGVAVDIEPSKATSLAVLRGPDGEAYGDDDCDSFSELIPHFRRAARIHYRLWRSEAAERAVTDVLDNMPMAVAVTDSAMRVVFANRAAQRLSDLKRGLTLRGGELFAERADDSRRIRSLAAGLTDSLRDGEPVSGRAVALRRECGRPLQLMISPLPPHAVSAHASAISRPMFAVFVTDPDSRQETTPDLLRRMYGLTLAEAELLDRLVAGDDLVAVADHRGTSVQTARNQLKSIFRKLGVRRQSEAVALVLTSPVWQRHQAAVALLEPGEW